MNLWLLTLLGGAIISLITFIATLNNLLPSFLLPFVLAIYGLAMVFSFKK